MTLTREQVVSLWTRDKPKNRLPIGVTQTYNRTGLRIPQDLPRKKKHVMHP